MKKAISILVLLTAVVADAAVSIHVSPSGNDANPGTSDEPLATLTAAQTQARPAARESQPLAPTLTQAPASPPAAPVAAAPLAGASAADLAAVAKAGERREADLGGGVKLQVCGIPAGAFKMGDSIFSNEPLRGFNEKPHYVTLTKPFWLGRTEVTQAQWEKVMESNPSHFKGAELPVETVSWNDASDFCRKLTAKGLLPAGWHWALPTEAQWEYACRAGAFARNLNAMAWYPDNSGNKTHAVGTKTANPWGLNDMFGNVSEWCADWYAKYPVDAATDPTGPDIGSDHVTRGGSWEGVGTKDSSFSRGCDAPDYRDLSIGFRVAAVPGELVAAVPREVVAVELLAQCLPAAFARNTQAPDPQASPHDAPSIPLRNRSVLLEGNLGEHRDFKFDLTGAGPNYESYTIMDDGMRIEMNYTLTESENGLEVGYHLGTQAKITDSKIQDMAFIGRVLCPPGKRVEIVRLDKQVIALTVNPAEVPVRAGQPPSKDRQAAVPSPTRRILLDGTLGEHCGVHVILTNSGTEFLSNTLTADGHMVKSHYALTDTAQGPLVDFSIEVDSNDRRRQHGTFKGRVLCPPGKPMEIFRNGARVLALTLDPADDDKAGTK